MGSIPLRSNLPNHETPDHHQLLYQLRAAASTRKLSHVERLNFRLLEADEGILDRKRSSDYNRIRVAIVSLLFNWPSTGGGIVHTAELATFLSAAGYDVTHIYSVFDDWNIGQVEGDLRYHSRPIVFESSSWNIRTIADRFRQAVDEFGPDCVIITDSWNSKPHIANAMSGYPYFLRLAALECICPLNNVRLLINDDGQPKQCHRTQLASPEICQICVRDNQNACGPLHVDERMLSGFTSPKYAVALRQAFEGAAGVLVVNPLIATLCEPYCRFAHVIPSGFDSQRFNGLPSFSSRKPFLLLFAGLINEYMKGFHVVFEACAMLWNKRQDFELHITGDSSSSQFTAPFVRFRGWQDQNQLPRLIAECHALVVPTIAQEALGRTAVEAMGAARPVIASRIGGLPFTVTDGLTGLLVEPANPHDLMGKIERLVDDPPFAEWLGQNGQQKFANEFDWNVIIERHYRPLFAKVGNRS